MAFHIGDEVSDGTQSYLVKENIGSGGFGSVFKIERKSDQKLFALKTLHTEQLSAVMIHVPDWKEGLNWYQKAFPQAKRIQYPEFDFECLEFNGVQIEVVKADEKVGAGAFGLAVDWEVENFDEAVKHLTGLGATLYRGPGKLEFGRRMCKLKDPYGNLIGIRGP